MEERCRDDCSSISNFNPVTKVEPNDDEYVLCGEFVEVIPSTFPTLFPPRVKKENPLALGIIGDNPFGLKKLEIKLEDCLHELLATKIVKKEPEEKMYEDLEVAQRADDGDHDKEMSQEKNKQNHHELEEQDDLTQTKQGKCTNLQDGILCQCFDCKIHLQKLLLTSDNAENQNIVCLKSRRHLKCKSCNKLFRNKEYLVKHLRTHGGVKSFPCDNCGSAFTTKLALKNHKLYKHSENPFKKTCYICNKILGCDTSLKKHILNVHMAMNKNMRWKCKFCQKTFAQSKGLERHSNHIHLKKQEFICGECNAIFYVKDALVAHMKCWHLPKERFSCEICGRIFNTKSLLKKHNMTQHLRSQYSCEVCGKIFKTMSHVQRHMSVHSDKKPFTCQTCGKSFKCSSNLIQHQISHSDNRPHICNICGKTFRLRTHVKQHMTVHGLMNNHKCFICSKAFARKTELSSHLTTHGV